MIEPIAFALARAGDDLVFADFTIKGIPFFDTTILYGETTENKVERTDFIFSISTADEIANELSEGMEFTHTAFGRIHTFKIEFLTDDLTGWTSVTASLTGKDYA